MNTSYEHLLLTQFLPSIIDRKKFYWCNSWVPAAVLLGGDQPWLRRRLGISMAPQVGTIFNEAVRDHTAKQRNGIAARRTTRSDANNHRRYMMTRKSLDAAGCTGEPLLVIARNRVFLCILHCCMAFRRLFLAFLEAEVGNHFLKVAGEVQKILYRNRRDVRFGAHNARTVRRPTTCFGPGSGLRRYLHTSRRTPRGKRLWGCEHCYALCTRRVRLCSAVRADLLLLRFGNIAAGSRGRTICCSSKKIVIPCSRVRMHVGWDWPLCQGTLWRA